MFTQEFPSALPSCQPALAPNELVFLVCIILNPESVVLYQALTEKSFALKSIPFPISKKSSIPSKSTCLVLNTVGLPD